MSSQLPSFNERISREYREGLLDFAQGAGEAALVRAYELGRRALVAQLSILDVVRLHEQAVIALTQAGKVSGAPQLVQFLAEALSPFEMTLRAHRENVRLLGLGGPPVKQDDDVARAREQLRTILDATTAIIYLRDVSGGFLFVNKQFEAVFQVRRDENTGTIKAGALAPDVDRALYAGDATALERRVPCEIEDPLVLPDGEHTYLSLKFPLLDPKGIPYAVCSVATDISERRRAEEAIRAARDLADEAVRELRETQAQLIQSAKMASLGELVAGVAHEINNPLAFAIAHLDTVRRSLANYSRLGAASPSPAAESEWNRATNRLEEMGGGLARIRELVQKLRVFSRLDEGEWKEASVQDCVGSVLMILGHRLKDRILVETEFRPPDVIACYPALLNQALLNILANAIDASPEGGKIRILTSGADAEFRIQVTDSGPGIPPALRDRVFEPFFTTKPVGAGTGLGLSITYAIVKKHQGTIELDLPEGGGTTVTIRLPLANRSP